METLLASRWPVLKVYATQEAIDDSQEVFNSPAFRGISLHIVERPRLEELSKTTDHQGLVARLGSYAYGTMDDLMASVAQAEPTARPLIVMCDRIQDSFNFGAILRCCDGANATAVIVGERGQAGMTPHVIRSSSGAANWVPVIQTPDLCEAVKRIQASGALVVAADLNSRQNMWNSNLQGFNLLLLGSEAHGVHPDLLALCGTTITIPMQGRVESLNVAVAAGILLYEIRRQQQC